MTPPRLLSALCLLLFSAAPQLSHADSITWHPWTGDSSSGIHPGTQWAYHFGSTTTATVNGVSVPGVAGANPAVAGQFAITGLPNVFNSDTNALTAAGGTGSAVMARDFLWGGNATVSLSGLTAGVTYTASLFSVGWGDAVRAGTFSTGGGGVSLAVDQQKFGQDQGIRVDCTFTASSSSKQITITGLSGMTWHLYGIALRTVTASPPHTDFTRTITAATGTAANTQVLAA